MLLIAHVAKVAKTYVAEQLPETFTPPSLIMKISIPSLARFDSRFGAKSLPAAPVGNVKKEIV